MAKEQLFTATGQIMVSDEFIEATSKGTTKSRAQNNLLKRLCNKLRFRVVNSAFWVEWPNLTALQQDEWLAKVNAKLSWIDMTPHTSKLDAESFRDALEEEWE